MDAHAVPRPAGRARPGWVSLSRTPNFGGNIAFYGGEDDLRQRGVDVTVLDDQECIAMMRDFIEQNPELWNEDIGEE